MTKKSSWSLDEFPVLSQSLQEFLSGQKLNFARFGIFLNVGSQNAFDWINFDYEYEM